MLPFCLPNDKACMLSIADNKAYYIICMLQQQSGHQGSCHSGSSSVSDNRGPLQDDIYDIDEGNEADTEDNDTLNHRSASQASSSPTSPSTNLPLPLDNSNTNSSKRPDESKTTLLQCPTNRKCRTYCLHLFYELKALEE